MEKNALQSGLDINTQTHLNHMKTYYAANITKDED